MISLQTVNELTWSSVQVPSTNPQFRVQVDIRNEEEDFDMNCFVTLMQKPSERNRKKARYYQVALNLFQIPPGTRPGRLDQAFFRRNSQIGQIQYNQERDVTNWYRLSPGEYAIIPSMLQQYMRAKFVLSIYTKAHMKIQ
ncbi:calpain-11-like [Eucyclogobius newberryi]|uniref:calpain-11-like n=1 Tax=Eucyclogobius newberryi TaxID=166745 RepID=UPI003B58CE57